MNSFRVTCLSVLSLATLPAFAAPPPGVITHQGRILVGGANYGSPTPATGHFKFAFTDQAGATVHWSNTIDNAPADGEPDAAVPVTVTSGLYSLGLGDIALTNMDSAVPAAVFEANDEVYLRVWFATDAIGPFEELTPKTRLTSNAYALHAAKAAGVSDGGITNAMLAAGSVTADKLDGGISFDDADSDPANELQTLGQVGTDITLSDGGGTVSIKDADPDPANEHNTNVALAGTTLNVTDGGGTLSANLAALVNDADASPTNEIQNLSLSTNTLSISGGNSVNLSGLVDDGDWSYFSGSGLNGKLTRSGDIALGSFTDPDGHGLNVQNYSSGRAAVRGADQNGTFLYAEGMLGVLSPSNLPTPVPITVANIGVLGMATDNGGNAAAVYGWNYDDQTNGNYAGIFVTDGAATSGTNYALYAQASNNAGRNVAAYLEGEVEIVGDASVSGRGAFGTALLTDVAMVIRGADDLDNNEALIVENSTGTDIITVENSGQVGIGNANPFARLMVTGDGVDPALRVQNGGSTKLLVNPNGGTTIGTFSDLAPANGLYVSGNVTIGISATGAATGYELSVDGQIACEEILVDLSGNWPDYVFADDYELRPLSEVEAHIEAENHLPGIPSAADVETSGLKLGEMQTLMMEKIEELTLYTIRQEKRLEAQAREIERLKSLVDPAQ